MQDFKILPEKVAVFQKLEAEYLKASNILSLAGYPEISKNIFYDTQFIQGSFSLLERLGLNILKGAYATATERVDCI